VKITSYLASPWTDPNRKQSAHGDSIFALDGVRGFAVMIVMASHSEAFGMSGQGSLGVLLFFTLSGFVLTLPFAEQPERILRWSAVARFFANRALRIMPIFAVAVLYIRWFIGEEWTWVTTNLTFAGGWTHLWSVAEEVRFYFLFPVVIAALALVPSVLRIPALLAMILIAWRSRLAHTIDTMINARVEFYLWFFLAGVLACFLHSRLAKFAKIRVARLFVGIISLFILALVFVSSDAAIATIWRPIFPRLPGGLVLNGWVQPGLWCALFVMLLVGVTAFSRTLASRWVQSWPMRHIGLLSYSLYLFHVPVLMLLEPHGIEGALLFLSAFAITYFIAIISYLAVEKPFLMLKPKARIIKMSNNSGRSRATSR
jgi:peptidoglycan/LPS O-acetylase OafA/YrhL